MLDLTKEQLCAVDFLRKSNLDTNQGMHQNLFLLISGLIPLPNVDLLLTNEKGQLLLTWRKDMWFQSGWHIPGGCLHYGESFEHCVRETAKRELSVELCNVVGPVATKNVIRGVVIGTTFPRERGHNVAMLFRCSVPSDWKPDNGIKSPDDNGYMCWFDKIPDDFLEIQHVYDDILSPWL